MERPPLAKEECTLPNGLVILDSSDDFLRLDTLQQDLHEARLFFLTNEQAQSP
jgi:hypothetical protein